MPRRAKQVVVIWKCFYPNKQGFKLERQPIKQRARELSREGNYLLEVPPQLSKLTDLRYLNLSCNTLGDSIERVSVLRNLLELNLSFTYIDGLPPSFANLQKLQVLHIDFNLQIYEVPAVLEQMTTLVNVSMHKCGLNLHAEHEPHLERLAKLTRLVHLDLSENTSLETVPAEFFALKHLRHLNLYNNRPACIESAKSILKPEQISLVNLRGL